MIDPPARRLIVAAALRLWVARRVGPGPSAGVPDAAPDARADAGRDLVAIARSLMLDGDDADDLQRRYGLVIAPPYPGVTAGPEGVTGGERLVLACLAHHRGEPAATVLTTLVRGRPPQVTAAPPGVGWPAGWGPVR